MSHHTPYAIGVGVVGVAKKGSMEQKKVSVDYEDAVENEDAPDDEEIENEDDNMDEDKVLLLLTDLFTLKIDDQIEKSRCIKVWFI